MKNFLKQNYFKLVICLLIYFFFGINNSQATSGACSYHNGVNCSVRNYDGHAVCNDGFVSSVYYSDMAKCACVYPVKSGCVTEIDYQLLEMGLTSELEKKENRPRIGGFITKMEVDEIEQMRRRNTLLLLQCRNEITEYQQAMTEYNSCRDVQNSISTLPQPTPTPRSCPINSYDNGSQCTCALGYIANTTRDGCVLATTLTPIPIPTPTPTPFFTPIPTTRPTTMPTHVSIPTLTRTATPKPTNRNEQKYKTVANTATRSYNEIVKKGNVIVRFVKFFRGLFKQQSGKLLKTNK